MNTLRMAAATSHSAIKYGLILCSVAAAEMLWLVGVLWASPDISRTLLWIGAAAALLITVNASNALAQRILCLRKGALEMRNVAESSAIEMGGDCLIVYCAIVRSRGNVLDLLTRLYELKFVSPYNCGMGILLDFQDAASKSLPGEEEILKEIVDRIQTLNASSGRRYYLFYREREFNTVEGVWMGWERKRGKVVQLARALETGDFSKFPVCEGDLFALRGARYLVTLDEDTRLGRQAVGAMLKTIKRPEDASLRNAQHSMYAAQIGVVQPVPILSRQSAIYSVYSWLSYDGVTEETVRSGITNFYENIFRRGSFYGKGMLDVRALASVSNNWITDNSVLSHDLLEGALLGCRLLTNHFVLEDAPKTIIACRLRRHRWIRGDWQLLRWLRPHVTTPRGLQANPLCALDRWKIIDNILRSLFAPAAFCYIVVGLISGFHIYSFTALLCATAAPWIFDVVAPLFSGSFRVKHLIWFGVVRPVIKSIIDFTILPFDAYLNIDAIARAIWRMAISRRKLLEWWPYSDAQTRAANLHAYLRWMAPGVGISLAFLIAAELTNAFGSDLVRFASVLWLFGPILAWAVSVQLSSSPAVISHGRS